MGAMYRVKELDLRLPARGHVIRRADAESLGDASTLLADAEKKAEEIVAAAREKYEEEKQRGYRDGLELAATEAAARLIDEQAVLDSCLAGLEEELAALVIASVRKLIGGLGDTELARTHVANALRRMRRQKRIRLSVAPGQHDAIRDAIAGFSRDFPEIELIDLAENASLSDFHFVMESEIGRIEGSVERNLGRLGDTLAEAARRHAPAGDSTQHASIPENGHDGA